MPCSRRWHRPSTKRHQRLGLPPCRPRRSVSCKRLSRFRTSKRSGQRIARVLPPYLKAERDWSAGLERRIPERSGALDLEITGQVCRLTGRADRIDLYADGTATILDFKTGNPPSLAQVKTFAPQLPLSVAMLGAGGFRDVSPHPARAARYVQTGGNRDPFKVTSLDDAEELRELAAEAMAKLEALWATFLLGAPFTPLLRPERARDQAPTISWRA